MRKNLLQNSTRDSSIDILRCLALTGIILVHSKPALFWAQLRSFDVPLMVLLSAVCFNMNVGGHFSYSSYLKKRFVRLVMPSWIFLTCYFIGNYALTKHISISKMIACYTLTTSWYFWIIRILFGMAIIAPFLKMLSDKMTIRNLLLICILMFGATELLALLSSVYFYKLAIMFIPYAAIYQLGMNVKRFSGSSILKSGLLLLMVYIAIAVILYVFNGAYLPTGKFKYPPRIYYVTYALGASALLWYYRQGITKMLQIMYLHKFAQFVGSHTFWIYLWHIPFVDYMVNQYDSPTTFVTVYFIAIVITYLQTTIVNKICDHVSRPTLRKNLQMIFIG